MNQGMVVLLGAIAGFTIYLGLPIAKVGGTPKLRTFLSSLSVGVLMFLIIEIGHNVLEAVEQAFKQAYGHPDLVPNAIYQGLLAVAGVGVGLLSLVAYENHLKAAKARAKTEESPLAGMRRIAMLVAVGIGLHNFAEGLAIGQSFASGAMSLGLMLVIGFGLHNATEGFGIAAPMCGNWPGWKFMAVAGLVGGGPTFLGTILGTVWVNDYVNTLFMALAVGSIIYVTVELMALGQKSGFRMVAMSGLLVGLFMAFSSELVINYAGAVQQVQAARVRTIEVKAGEFYYLPNQIPLKVNEPVEIVVTNVGTIEHEFEIRDAALGHQPDEWKIPKGQTIRVRLRPSAAGSYPFICDLPQHMEAGMHGEFVVTP